MKFTIATNASLVDVDATVCHGKFFATFDNRVKTKIENDTLTFWFGASWPIELPDVTENTIVDQSGSWFFGVITPTKVSVYTDLCADYPVYYANVENDIVVTNVFNNFTNTMFPINNQWVADALGKHHYIDQYLPKVNINIVNVNYEFYNTSTALDNVHRMPHCGKLTFEDTLEVSQYYDRVQAFKDALVLPEIDDINSFTRTKINQNIKHIINQQSGKIGVLSSTGVDSLTIVDALLSQQQNFKVAAYGFTTDSILSEWADNAHQLLAYLNSVGIESDFDEIKPEEFYSRFQPDTWTIPSKFDDLYQDANATKTLLNDCGYLIKGTNGDECFLHAQRYAMIYLAASLKVSFSEAIEICKKHYSYQGSHAYVVEPEYQVMLEHNLFDTIIDTWALKPQTYLSDDRVFTNKPTFSPYCDRELSTITARMNARDLAASILDAGPQQAMLDKTAKFLNRYKSGEQYIKDHTFELTEFAVTQLQFLEQYIQNNHLEELLCNILLAIRGVSVGDFEPYDFLLYVQMATWLQTRHE